MALWQLHVLRSRERRRGQAYTADELRVYGYEEDFIAAYLAVPLVEATELRWVRGLTVTGLQHAGLFDPEATVSQMRRDGLSAEQVVFVVAAIIAEADAQARLVRAMRERRQLVNDVDEETRIAEDRQIVRDEGFFSRYWTTTQFSGIMDEEMIPEYRAEEVARKYYRWLFEVVERLGLAGRALELWHKDAARQIARQGLTVDEMRGAGWPEERIASILALWEEDRRAPREGGF